MLAALVSQRPGENRMAFEYLTAWYLLKGQLPKVVQQIERLDEFGYAEIPPLWQEAILIYAYGTGKRGRSAAAWPISPEMHRRIQYFSSVVNKHGRNRDAAMAELARDYRRQLLLLLFQHGAGATMKRSNRYLAAVVTMTAVALSACVVCLAASGGSASELLVACRAAPEHSAGLRRRGDPAEHRAAELSRSRERIAIPGSDRSPAGRFHLDREPLGKDRDPAEVVAQAAGHQSGARACVRGVGADRVGMEAIRSVPNDCRERGHRRLSRLSPDSPGPFRLAGHGHLSAGSRDVRGNRDPDERLLPRRMRQLPHVPQQSCRCDARQHRGAATMATRP